MDLSVMRVMTKVSVGIGRSGVLGFLIFITIFYKGCCCSILRASLAIRKIKYFNETQERPNVAFRPNSPFECFSNWQKIRPRERVYPYDIIVHNGGLEQY